MRVDPAQPEHRVLFVGHGAERSGPPIFLLHLQRWMQRNVGLPFETVLARGGVLEEEYRTLGPVHVLDPRWTAPRVLEAGLGRLGRVRSSSVVRRARHRSRLRGLAPASVVYLNTVSSGGIDAVRALPFSAPLISHVHELEVGLRYGLDEDERRFVLDRSARLLAASQAVADNLVGGHGVDPARIHVHHELVDTSDRPDAARAAAVRTRFGIPEGAPVVGASGMTDWRKAPDLFVRLAWEISRRPGGRDVRFLWVGGADRGPAWWPIEHDLRTLGLLDRVHFAGESPHLLDELSLCDLFVLPSREDAFPLACLEAGSLDLPVVAFDRGGMPEIIEPSDGGAVVPYPDVAQMAEEVLALLSDPERRVAAGRRLGDAVRAHHDVEVLAPAFVDEILDLC